MKEESFTVSVIIPTAGHRPEFLRRAIESALIDDEFIQIEILVILNGKHGLAFDILSAFQHVSVKYFQIEEANVSNARNFGLSIAQGDLIRFLDDDDYLFPDIAYKQYLELYQSGADFSTYNFRNVDYKFREYGTAFDGHFKNGYEALFAGKTIAIPLLHVYKKNAIHDLKWNVNSSNGEDFEWLFSILFKENIKWIFNVSLVGVWFHHKNERLSKPYTENLAIKTNVDNIKKLYVTRKEYGLKSYYISGVVFYSRKAFCLDPIYWAHIIKLTHIEAGESCKKLLYNGLGIHILFIEWMLLPLRVLSRFFKRYIFNINSYLR